MIEEKTLKDFVKGKVFVFIDVANVFYAQKTLGWRISYERLIKYFKKECDLGKCFVYTAYIEENNNQKRFLKMLEKSGFVVRAKPVKKIRLKTKNYEWKGNLDVELVIDVLDNLQDFQTLILLSGDSDFTPLLRRIKKDHKRALVMSTKDHVAKELLEEAKFVNLKKLRKEIELKP